MRRILRKVAADKPDELGDVSTLADPSVVEEIVRQHLEITQEIRAKYGEQRSLEQRPQRLSDLAEKKENKGTKAL